MILSSPTPGTISRVKLNTLSPQQPPAKMYAFFKRKFSCLHGDALTSLLPSPGHSQNKALDCVLRMITRGEDATGVYDTSSTYNWNTVQKDLYFQPHVNKKIAVEVYSMAGGVRRNRVQLIYLL